MGVLSTGCHSVCVLSVLSVPCGALQVYQGVVTSVHRGAKQKRFFQLLGQTL